LLQMQSKHVKHLQAFFSNKSTFCGLVTWTIWVTNPPLFAGTTLLDGESNCTWNVYKNKPYTQWKFEWSDSTHFGNGSLKDEVVERRRIRIAGANCNVHVARGNAAKEEFHFQAVLLKCSDGRDRCGSNVTLSKREKSYLNLLAWCMIAISCALTKRQ
jgi:hypothetical protein